MVFKATNSPTGVAIEGQVTEIENLSGQATASEGVVIIDRESAIYIANSIGDLKAITALLSNLIKQLNATFAGPTPPAGSPLSPLWSTLSPLLNTEIEKIEQGFK